MRVVDESGVPVAGAYVTGSVGEPATPMDWEPRHESFRGVTDVEGHFEVMTPGSVLIEIQAEGFFPFREKWWSGKIPADGVEVVLSPAPHGVPMFEIRAGSNWWKEDRSEFALGIQLKPPEGIRSQTVYDQTKADLWFDFQKMGSTALRQEDVPTAQNLYAYNTSQWRIRLIGRNGWSLAPSPYSVPFTSLDTQMIVAPENGYETELTLPHEYKKAHSFFLRHGDGDRYGKITRFEFCDETRGGINQGSFFLQGFVQEKSTGSRTVFALSPRLAWEREMADRGTTVPEPEITGRPLPQPKPARPSANNSDTRRKVLILVGAFLVSAIGFFVETGYMGKRND